LHPQEGVTRDLPVPDLQAPQLVADLEHLEHLKLQGIQFIFEPSS
jgi:hypothetical protein